MGLEQAHSHVVHQVGRGPSAENRSCPQLLRAVPSDCQPAKTQGLSLTITMNSAHRWRGLGNRLSPSQTSIWAHSLAITLTVALGDPEQRTQGNRSHSSRGTVCTDPAPNPHFPSLYSLCAWNGRICLWKRCFLSLLFEALLCGKALATPRKWVLHSWRKMGGKSRLKRKYL